jgi:hypothetical protein
MAQQITSVIASFRQFALPTATNVSNAGTRLTEGVIESGNHVVDGVCGLGSTFAESIGLLFTQDDGVKATPVESVEVYHNPLYGGPTKVEHVWPSFSVLECENFVEELKEAMLPLTTDEEDPIRVV